MIKILLVDDEKIIRKGLAKIIEKLDGDFEVIGEAGNGLQALELVRQICPDIVITDIRMPKMDGLQLVQSLEEQYPDIKKIILSGFDDFEYARKAMRFKTSDYLLKPVDEACLHELLKKTSETIRNEIEQRLAAASLKDQIGQSQPILRQVFLRALVVEGKYQSLLHDELVQLSAVNDIKFNNQAYYVLLICAEHTSDQQGFIVPPAEWLPHLDGLLTNLIRSSSLIEGNNLVVICGLPEHDADIISSIFDRLNDAGNQGPDYRFIISSGQVMQEPAELKKSYDSALLALSQHFYQPQTTIFHYDAIANPFNASLPSGVTERFNQQLISIFETQNIQKIQPIVCDYMAVIGKYWLNPIEVRRIIDESCASMRSINPRFRQAHEEVHGDSRRLALELKQITTLDQTGSYLVSFFTTILNQIKKHSGQKDKRIIEVIKNHIQDHYMEEITLNSLSQIVYISPNYLSEVFKEQTGESIVDYITRLRIIKAKEMLKDIQVKVYEVCKLVGYEDPAYFSKVFRKVVGVSPTEYRNMVI
jgi:two-component system response regulator YesN